MLVWFPLAALGVENVSGLVLRLRIGGVGFVFDIADLRHILLYKWGTCIVVGWISWLRGLRG